MLWADNQWGMSAGYAGSTFGMDNAGQSKGGRLTLDDHLFPEYWHHFELFLQASTAYYMSDYQPLKSTFDDNLWVFAIAPVVRYHVATENSLDPFIELSSGPGYLSTIHYENRNFGIHFTVQSMFGMGATFGETHQWAAELQILHYSNAGLSVHNRGFTSPVFMSMSYQF
ncbi:MAG: acyloxyacyl hydrolase [Pseudomonadota bacterium]